MTACPHCGEEIEEAAAPELPDEKTIGLRKSVEDPTGKPITELRLREPTAGEIEAITAKTGVAGAIFAVAKIAGVTESAIRKLGARDFNEAAEYVLGFLELGQPTGKTG